MASSHRSQIAGARAHNAVQLSLLSPRLIARLLRVGFSSGDFSPLIFDAEPDVPYQIRNALRIAGPEAADRFLEGLQEAMGEWEPYIHGVGTFSGLALTAALLRAVRTIPLMRSALRSDFPSMPAPDRNEGFDATLIALTALAPHPEVEDLFFDLLFEKDFEHQFVAQILLGCLVSAPNRWTEAVPRYLDVLDRFPDTYQPSTAVMGYLVDELGLRKVSRSLQSLPSQYWSRFLKELCRDPHSPADLFAEDDAFFLLDSIQSEHGPQQMYPIDSSRLEDDEKSSFQDALYWVSVSLARSPSRSNQSRSGITPVFGSNSVLEVVESV